MLLNENRGRLDAVEKASAISHATRNVSSLLASLAARANVVKLWMTSE